MNIMLAIIMPVVYVDYLTIIWLTVYNYDVIFLKGRKSRMLEYISAPEAAKEWGISERRVQRLCEDGRIPGIIRFGRM